MTQTMSESDFDAHQSTLVDLQNSLNDAEHDLAVFFDRDAYDEGEGMSAGQTLLTALQNVATDLASLISAVSDTVQAAEREQDNNDRRATDAAAPGKQVP